MSGLSLFKELEEEQAVDMESAHRIIHSCLKSEIYYKESQIVEGHSHHYIDEYGDKAVADVPFQEVAVGSSLSSATSS